MVTIFEKFLRIYKYVKIKCKNKFWRLKPFPRCPCEAFFRFYILISRKNYFLNFRFLDFYKILPGFHYKHVIWGYIIQFLPQQYYCILKSKISIIILISVLVAMSYVYLRKFGDGLNFLQILDFQIQITPKVHFQVAHTWKSKIWRKFNPPPNLRKWTYDIATGTKIKIIIDILVFKIQKIIFEVKIVLYNHK